MVNSRRKGSKSERSVAKLFQAWTGYEFARTPGSGGLAWKNRSQVSGDIVCTDPLHTNRFAFSIEIKFHKEIKFEHLIMDIKNIDILKFWEQASGDGERANKIPMLLMRYNMMPRDMYFLCLPQPFFLKLKKIIPKDLETLTYKGKHHFVIMDSREFFKTEYKAIHKSAKQFLRDGKL